MSGYGAIPLRAAKAGLSPGAWSLLLVISFHDRDGANGQHCTAGSRTLAEEAGLNYKLLSRYATELAEAGLIEIIKCEEDGRRRVYRVISDEQAAAIVINSDDKKGEIVITSNSQVIETKGVYESKKSSEANKTNPAKQYDIDGVKIGQRYGRAAPAVARQGEAGVRGVHSTPPDQLRTVKRRRTQATHASADLIERGNAILEAARIDLARFMTPFTPIIAWERWLAETGLPPTAFDRVVLEAVRAVSARPGYRPATVWTLCYFAAPVRHAVAQAAASPPEWALGGGQGGRGYGGRAPRRHPADHGDFLDYMMRQRPAAEPVVDRAAAGGAVGGGHGRRDRG